MNLKKTFLASLALLLAIAGNAVDRQYVWPKKKMPDAQPHLIAAMTDVSKAEGFNADKYRIPYLDWLDAPAEPNGGCMILISGGGYYNCCDMNLVQMWGEEFTKLGFQCVNFVYRTPRPEGLPIYQTAWEDAQRAVRLVRSQAGKRGFDPEKIGAIGMSAGAHLTLLLATNSQTRAYEPIDKTDEVPCHINWAIANAPAYVTTDGEEGTAASRQGYGPDIKLSSVFKFDEKTCPVTFQHGGKDPYSPNGSTLFYRELRKRGIPAELHLYPNKYHGAFGFERTVEFINQMGFIRPPEPEVKLMDRFPSDAARDSVVKFSIWPEGKMPCRQENQCEPYIEWHFPKVLKTKAIQIIYSGGSYTGNDPDGFEVAPARRYLNEMGMTVVTLKYRTPRPSGLQKHVTAWQDLQRAIRIVRVQAPGYGLDPQHIGIMGSSAGGHLTVLAATSSLHQSYNPIDGFDKASVRPQWAIGIYPAYCLDGNSDWSKNMPGGNDDSDRLVPELSFDLHTCPMLFIHGDADVWPAMNSVKIWEKMRAMGIQSELHTLALRPHCFQRTASPGTGSYNWLDRIGEYVKSQVKFEE